MFWLFSLTLACGMGILVFEERPRAALWIGWIVSVLLLPTWSVVHVGPFLLDLRTVAAVLGLAGLWWSGLLAGRAAGFGQTSPWGS